VVGRDRHGREYGQGRIGVEGPEGANPRQVVVSTTGVDHRRPPPPSTTAFSTPSPTHRNALPESCAPTSRGCTLVVDGSRRQRSSR
jgi:hypothetical protein